MLRGAGWYLGGLLLLALVAFWPSYLSTFPAADAYTHAHAGLMTLWFGYLLGQPLLIRRGLRRQHRLLGRTSFALVPLIVAVSLLLAHARFGVLDEATLRAEGHFLFLPLAGAWLFLATWLLGVVHRRDTPQHSRYMLCTALPLIDPVVARLLFFYAPELPHLLLYSLAGYGVTDAILLALMLREPAGTPGRRAFTVLLALYVATHLLWFTFGQSGPWLSFVYWFRGLGMGPG
jgi:hypothetical protein